MSYSVPVASREQVLAARIMAVGGRLALWLMAGGYLAYLLGVGTPRVSPAQAQANWHLAHGAFARSTGLPQGWGFLVELHHTDMLAMAGLCLVPLVSLVAVTALVPGCLRRREWLFGGVCVALVCLVVVTALGLGAGR